MTGLPEQAPAAGDITNVFFYKDPHNRDRYSVGAVRARRAEEARDAQQLESTANIERMLGLSPLAGETGGRDEECRDKDDPLGGDIPGTWPGDDVGGTGIDYGLVFGTDVALG